MVIAKLLFFSLPATVRINRTTTTNNDTDNMADFRFVDPSRIEQDVQRIVHDIYEANKPDDKFYIGLSGGSMPAFMTKVFKRMRHIDWSRWIFFVCDERLVPEDSPLSNAGTYKRLFNAKPRLPIEPHQFITVNTSLPGEKAAEDYQVALLNNFSSNPPRFHMLFLGVGDDGHTCSLFPNHPLLDVSLNEQVIETNTTRHTLTHFVPLCRKKQSLLPT